MRRWIIDQQLGQQQVDRTGCCHGRRSLRSGGRKDRGIVVRGGAQKSLANVTVSEAQALKAGTYLRILERKVDAEVTSVED